jgi:hypothetical protein
MFVLFTTLGSGWVEGGEAGVDVGGAHLVGGLEDHRGIVLVSFVLF